MINFRSHTRDIINFRIKWLNNKKVNGFVIDNPEHITDIKEQEKWFDDYEKGNEKKFFTIYDDNKPVGFMGLSKINSLIGIANLFVMIGEDDYRGRGIGKTALDYLIKYGFKELGLKKIELEVKRENFYAIKAFKIAGFVETGEDESEIKMALVKKKNEE